MYVIPLLVGLVAAAMFAGPAITRTGRYKIYPIIGAVLTGASMYALSRADATTGSLAPIVPLVVAGIGIGFFVQVSLLVGQNAAEHKDLGVATGTLNFFMSIGGALGAALFGAILNAGLGYATPTTAVEVHGLPDRVPLDGPVHRARARRRAGHEGEAAVGGDDPGGRGRTRSP